jgi:hypothetical protein
MKIKLLTILIIIEAFIIAGVNSQTPQQNRDETNRKFRKSLIDKLNQEKRLIEKLLGVDIYKQFDGRFEKLIEQFDDGFYDNMDKIFKDQNFNNFFKNANQFKFGFGALGLWTDDGKNRIYTLQQNFPKNAPLDIKIENNYIKIKGVVEKSFKKKGPKGEISDVKRMSVNQEIQIPSDVFAEKAQFRMLQGKTQILFPKKVPTGPMPNNHIKEKKVPKPLKRRKGDYAI